MSRAPLELVFSDVWGPAPTSVGKNNFYVSFIDDYSKFTWIYLLRHKSDAFQRFHDFQNIVERMFDRKIVAMQTNWGGEYQKLNSFSNALAFHTMSLARMHINKMAQPNASIGILLELVFRFLLTPPCPSSFGMRLSSRPHISLTDFLPKSSTMKLLLSAFTTNNQITPCSAHLVVHVGLI